MAKISTFGDDPTNRDTALQALNRYQVVTEKLTWKDLRRIWTATYFIIGLSVTGVMFLFLSIPPDLNQGFFINSVFVTIGVFIFYTPLVSTLFFKKKCCIIKYEDTHLPPPYQWIEISEDMKDQMRFERWGNEHMSRQPFMVSFSPISGKRYFLSVKLATEKELAAWPNHKHTSFITKPSRSLMVRMLAVTKAHLLALVVIFITCNLLQVPFFIPAMGIIAGGLLIAILIASFVHSFDQISTPHAFTWQMVPLLWWSSIFVILLLTLLWSVVGLFTYSIKDFLDSSLFFK